MGENAMQEQVPNASAADDNASKVTMTANEVSNAIGESYKTVAKILKAMATRYEIDVTEKEVNKRRFAAYKLTVADIQAVKSYFRTRKHLEAAPNSKNVPMVTNAYIENSSDHSENNTFENPNVKFFEVVQENSELSKKVNELNSQLQLKINENVKLDADLAIANSTIKFIEDKTKYTEAEVSKKEKEVQQLQAQIRSKNYMLITLGAALLIIFTVFLTLHVVR